MHVDLHYGRPGVFDGDLDITLPDASFLISSASLWFPIEVGTAGPSAMLVTEPRPGAPEWSTSLIFPAGRRWQGDVDLADPGLERIRLPDYVDPQDRTTLSYQQAGDLDGDGKEDLFTTSLKVETWAEGADGRLSNFAGSDVRLHIGFSTLPSSSTPR